MGCFYFITRQIADLNSDTILKETNLSTLKRNTDILVIDDDDFTYLDALEHNEFRMTHRTDIQSLTDVAGYDMILCDIRGVGKYFQSGYEGAYLVKQLKEKYPNKIIIAYTAESYNPKYEDYLKYADAIVQKGTTLEDWDALLSQLIRDLANPVKQWEKTRKALFDAHVSTISVAEYENQFVKAVQKGNFESIKKLYSKKNDSISEVMSELFNIASKFFRKAKE